MRIEAKRHILIVGMTLTGGLVLRLLAARYAYFSTFDTGTVELMGLHILNGERPLFFYGQKYMGAAEAYLAAFFMKLLGPTEVAAVLSPIVTSLLWVVGIYLFFRWAAGRQAGLAAAVTVALPGWVVLWYCIAPYGGYPVFWAAGVWALAAAFRLWQRAPEASGWAEATLMGIAAGLGLWTNFQVLPYLAGAALLWSFWLRRAGWRRAWRPSAWAAALTVACAWPVANVLLHHRMGRLAEWNFSPAYIRHTAAIAVQHTLRRLIFWRMHPPVWYMVLVVSVIGVSLLLALSVIWERRRDRRLTAAALGIAVVLATELALYLPHSLASLVVPRYLVGFWTLLLAAGVGIPLASSQRWVRRAAWAAVLLLSVHFVATDILMIRGRADRVSRIRRSRRELIAAVEACGATNAIMIGGNIFGLNGQALSFLAEDKVHFSSVFGERYRPYAQWADADPRGALVCEHRRMTKLRNTLRDLGSTGQVRRVDGFGLSCSSSAAPLRGRALPPELVICHPFGETEGEGSNVLDRRRETVLRGRPDGHSGLVLELRQRRRIGALVLSSLGVYRKGLPEAYRLEYSPDGTSYRPLRDNQRRFAVGYTCGPRVYTKGYLGSCEIRFPPVRARFLRLTISRAESRGGMWCFNEVYVVEAPEKSPGLAGDEVDRIACALQESNAVFVAADRWLSAQLWSRLSGHREVPPVYPRFDPRHGETLLSRRLSPYEGLVIAPSRVFRDECLRQIRRYWGAGIIIGQRDFPGYSLIFLGNPPSDRRPPELFWDGFTLLATDDIHAGLYLTEEEMHAETPERPAHRPCPGWLRPVVIDVGGRHDRRFLGYGWSRREEIEGRTARWMKHLEADFVLEAGRRADLLVVCRVSPMVKRGMVQTLGLYVNGHFAGYERLPGRGFRSVPFLVPADDLRIGDNLFTLRAGFRRRAGGRDRRRVAVAVDRIVVVPLDRISAEEAVALASLAAEGGSRPRTSE